MPLLVLVLGPEGPNRDARAEAARTQGHAVVCATAPAEVPLDLSPEWVWCADPVMARSVRARFGQEAHVEPPPDHGHGRLLVLGSARVDLQGQRVFRATDGPEGLLDKEAALLAHLVARPNEVVSRAELLEQVWGYRPTMRTRTVDNTVRRLRTRIEADPSSPDHVCTVRGQGYRFVPLPSAPEPTLRSQPQPQPPRAASPAPSDSIIGRSAELRDLNELAGSGPGVVTVLGAPGIGKTTLVRTWCSGPFIELASARTESDILAAVTDALDVEPSAIASALGPLVAFDNAEQVAEPLARLLTTWLATATQTTVVLTSRTRLGLPSERVLEVGPLTSEAAIELLLTRARAARPGFAQTERDRAHIASVVATLERVPLAIELAAARARMLSPRDLADRLRRDLSRLRDTSRPDRHASVEGACLWSWNLLDSAEKYALASLSVFRGGFSAPGAEALGIDIDVLEQLIDHSLVYVAGAADDQVRFDLLETIRSFAESLLEGDTARDLHAQWMTDWGALAEPRARESYDGLAALGRERANLTAAARHLIGRSPEWAARVLLASRPRWFMHHTPSDHMELLAALWQRLDDGAVKAGVGYHYSAALTRYGHVERSLPIAEQAVVMGRASGDPEALAEALMGLDFACQISGDAERAAARLREVPRGVPIHLRIAALVSWSTLHRRFGAAQQSEAVLREALGLAEAHGLEPYQVAVQGHLGGVLFIASREAESIALSEAALEVHRAHQNTREMVQIGTNLAAAYRTSGDPKRGLQTIEEVIELALKRGRPMETARAQMHLSRAQLATGDAAMALSTARASVRVSMALGSASDQVFGHVDVANALLDLGRPDDAIREAELSVQGATPLGVPRLIAMGLIAIARAHQDRGALERAAEGFAEAMAHDSDSTPLDSVYLSAALALVQVRAGLDGCLAAAHAQQLADSGQRTDRSRGVLPPLAVAMAALSVGDDPAARSAFARARDASRQIPDGPWGAAMAVYALAFDADTDALERALAAPSARVRHAACVVRSLDRAST